MYCTSQHYFLRISFKSVQWFMRYFADRHTNTYSTHRQFHYLLPFIAAGENSPLVTFSTDLDTNSTSAAFGLKVLKCSNIVYLYYIGFYSSSTTKYW